MRGTRIDPTEAFADLAEGRRHVALVACAVASHRMPRPAINQME
jgi:hypothetical protein